VLALPLRIAPPPRRERSFGESFRRGWATIVAAPGRPLLQLTAADAVQGLFAAAPALLIALLAVRSFGGDSTAYAVLFVAYVLGGVVAGAVVGHWNPRGRVGVLLGATLIAGGVFFAGVGNVPSLVVVVAAVWFGVGFAGAMYQDAKYAFLRGSVAPGELARVVSNLYLLPGVAATLGAVLLGEFAGRISVTAFAEIAGLGLAVAGVTALLLPGVRRLRY